VPLTGLGFGRWRRPPAARHGLMLALQGGGAHGAFTWGVLDALLEAGVPLAAASGTSAGAMNAAVLAHGLAEGGADGARAALAHFWHAIGSALPFDLLTVGNGDSPRLAPMLRWALHWTPQWLSPYDANPSGLNPLRDVLQAQLDIDRLRAPDALPLVIATTHANSGRLRCFGNAELSVDVLLASACLPTLHHAVAIDGEPYWDGGFSANPAVGPLLAASPSGDLMLVPLTPWTLGGTPRSAGEIHHRISEIGFGAGFLREMQWLAQLTAQGRRRLWPTGIEARLAGLRWHLVDGLDALAALAPESRLIAHKPFLVALHDAGRQCAMDWLARHRDAIGRRSSVDPVALFGGPLPPARATAAPPPA